MPDLIDRAALVSFMELVLRNLEAEDLNLITDSFRRGYRQAMTDVQMAATVRPDEAIIAHITNRGDTDGTFCAFINGVEHEFEARFDVDWERVGDFGQRDYDEASCTLIGAWAYDENGDVVFAGNRAELIALIGEAEVIRWEDEQAGREMGQ